MRPTHRLSFFAGLALALGIAMPVAAAGGTHTQSFTDNFHGNQTMTGTDPCNGDVVDLAETSNIVMHVTYFPASDESWATFTEEDKVTAVDEGSGVVYAGHSTFWGNDNVNRQNANFTFTGTIMVRGSDGSAIAYHEVGHGTMLPDGNIAVQFDKASVTCG